MPLTIPERIAERIRREAEKQGLAPEEYILEAITRDLDPDERAREYIESASALLEQAKEELQKGDLRQASEKVWGACALAIKAHAAARKGLVLKSHADLWLYKDEVANELGEWIRGAFLMADSMHKNFFEGLATAMDVTVALGEVEKLVKAIREVLK
jgi:alkyl sulfatase BDS1-like metallo-beta-lactamase superfamily hydrolase